MASDTPPIFLRLSRFLWEDSLDMDLKQSGLMDCLRGQGERLSPVRIDWSSVRFFEDMSLLKLIMIEQWIRSMGAHVWHAGLTSRPRDTAFVVRQLWYAGYIELLASSQLWPADDSALEGAQELFDVDPTGGRLCEHVHPEVMRIVCCHSKEHFKRPSRAMRLMERFDGISHRARFVAAVERTSRGWDLVDSGDFRSLIFEQLRLNVNEHARAGRPAGAPE